MLLNDDGDADDNKRKKPNWFFYHKKANDNKIEFRLFCDCMEYFHVDFWSLIEFMQINWIYSHFSQYNYWH